VQAEDSYILRFGASIGGSLWFAGGLRGSPFDWGAIATVTRTSPDGDLIDEFEIPVPAGRFFEARWIGAAGDDVLVLGAYCLLPLDNPHCPVTDKHGSAVLLRVGSDVVETKLPDLVASSEPGIEYRLAEVAGTTPDYVVASIAADAAVDTTLSASATVSSFAISPVGGTVTRLPTLDGLSSTGAACVSDNSLIALTVKPADDASLPPVFTLNRLALGDGTRGEVVWERVGTLSAQDSGLGNYRLVCSTSGAVYVAELTRKPTLLPAIVRGVMEHAEHLPLAGQVHSIEPTESGLLVTTFSEGRLQVQEVVDGAGIVDLLGPIEFRDIDARVVRVDGRLVDIAPAFAYNPRQGGEFMTSLC
jgi:hypothetical protein